MPPGRGRGSSVGSIVCYLTGLSHVDPVAAGLSLGRFLNREMAGVPDIDLDFPRDIREQLIVRIVERYGKEHAALVASFSSYRSRGAIRDVGKALGLPFGELERLARLSDTWDAREVGEELKRLPDAKIKLGSRRWRAFAALTAEIARLPRHVSQHPGGMVISSRPLVELVPVMPAAMRGRQICQWDKDSCADAGFLKIDLLGLGMLSAVESCVEEIARLHGEPIDLSRIPLDDPLIYGEIQRADTVGSFQIESRAQMQSLPQTLPANLDDLTVQVALVRPGPIQGKAIHPYVENRRRLRADPSFQPPLDHPLLAEPLRETLGVVVFQDQVLEVAMALAGFSVGEAEGLRRAMSRKRSAEALEAYRERFIAGAAAKGVGRETADRVYDKLASFSGFGFPKSHAAAFALLGYQSAWLRHYYPGEYLASLLNAQPMGFYPPAALVRDAQRRGLTVLPVDVNASAATSRVEDGAVRIGLLLVRALGAEGAKALVAERERGGAFADVCQLAQRSGLDERTLSRAGGGGRLRLVRPAAADAALATRPGAARQKRPGLGREGAPARPAPFPDRGHAQLARAVRLGANARRLPLDRPIDRRPPARPAPPRASAGHTLLARSPRCAIGLPRHRGRAGRRPPAPADGERRHLPAARGRDGAAERDRDAAPLRPEPRPRPRRADPARPRPPAALRRHHQRHRRGAEEPGSAGAPAVCGRRRARLAAGDSQLSLVADDDPRAAISMPVFRADR